MMLRESQTPDRMPLGKKLRRSAALGAAGLVVSVAVAPSTASRAAEGIKDRFDGPEMHGSQLVQIGPGDTLSDIANEKVDGGASHTGAVVDAMEDDPRNEDILGNGSKLGSEDLGEYLVAPKSVED